MADIFYDFVELESDESFQLLGKAFGATCTPNVLLFDSNLAKGEIVRVTPQQGLWIRKWKLATLDKITLRRHEAPADQEIKFSLVYFLNPSIFDLKSESKKIKVSYRNNNMLLSNRLIMHFSVEPNQPFYALDVTFTASWLLQQLNDSDFEFKEGIKQFLDKHVKQLYSRPCYGEECRILHELEQSMQASGNDILFIRSRAYNLVCSFFHNALKPFAARPKQNGVYYDRMVEAKTIIMEQLQTPPRIKDVAKQVNMSVSTLLRQFKCMYGKSVYEYHVEKKMELAKKMIMEDNVEIRQVAKLLGYKQVTPFIESFTKQFGYTPGSLKVP